MRKMKNEELLKAKIEERLRIVELLRKLSVLLVQRDGGIAADGYAAALIRGFSDLVEKDEGPAETPISLSVPPDTVIH
jgi:hypothetical protein